MKPYRIAVIGNYAIVEVHINRANSFLFYGGAAYNISIACTTAGHLPTGLACIGQDFDSGCLHGMLPEVEISVYNDKSCRFTYQFETTNDNPSIKPGFPRFALQINVI